MLTVPCVRSPCFTAHIKKLCVDAVPEDDSAEPSPRFGRSDPDSRVILAGCAVLSLDNYNDASRLIDGNLMVRATLAIEPGQWEPPEACSRPVHRVHASLRTPAYLLWGRHARRAFEAQACCAADPSSDRL